MKKQTETVVFYSYFDDKTGEYAQSSDGVVIEGTVTPQRVKAAVLQKWEKIGYRADIGSVRIEREEVLV